MDQARIGAFIAQERRHKVLTQRQLADMLGISDKTISKWECGKGLPEVSLMLPLCNVLEISVNDLLSGERLDESNYRRKAEENMLDLIRERKENWRRFWLMFISGMSSLVLFVMLFLLVDYLSDEIRLWAKIAIVAIGCASFFGSLLVLMENERTIGWYKCKHCGEKFVPDFRHYMGTMHMWTTRRLKCPQCGQRDWCKKVMGHED